ncbi:unnamed protein product [Heterobilharzia americana]|nr:unnamed protein product [Heterobilharzia americana]
MVKHSRLNNVFLILLHISVSVCQLPKSENAYFAGDIASVEASEDSMVTENSEVTPSQKVAGKYEAAYLAGDKETKFWLIQERTNELVFGWSPFHQDNIDELVLEQNVDWGFDITTSVRRNASSGDMHVIGKACEFEQFSIVGMDVGFIYNSVVDHRSLTYKRVPRIKNAHITMKPSRSLEKTTVSTPVTTLRDENDVSLLTENSEVTPSQKVAGKYEAAYLAGDKETKFWLIQERTNELVFGWSPFHQDNIDELVLEQNVDWGFDITTSVRRNASSGDMHVIGKACEFEQFSIVGMDVGFIYNSVVDHRSLTYKRVPRIKNAHITMKPSRSLEVNWELDKSFCSENDRVLIFQGLSNQPLEMHFTEDRRREFSMIEIQGEEGAERQLILTAQHEGLMALPILGKIIINSMKYFLHEITRDDRGVTGYCFSAHFPLSPSYL